LIAALGFAFDNYSILSPGASPATKLAHAAAVAALLVYGVGVAAGFFLPEPKEKLPE